MDRYPFTRAVEAQVVLAISTMPRFYEMVGVALDPERMPNEDARLLVGAAKEVQKRAPCTSTVFVIQHLRWMMNQGKVTHDQIVKSNELYELAEDLGGVDDLDALIANVVPAVQRVMHKDAVEKSISEFGKGQSPELSAERFQTITTLGSKKVSLGTEPLGAPDDILAAADSTLKDPLPTGILELDASLMGGLEMAALGVVMANSGDGKSLFLSSVAAQSVLDCRNVAYVTLELGEGMIKQRIYSNLLNMTGDEMLQDPYEASRRYKTLQARQGGLGRWRVVYMTPKVSKPSDVRTWLRDIKREANFDPDVLLVDYADKMSAKKERSYEDMEYVYEGLRDLAVAGEVKWLWTASQTTGRAGRKKKLDIEDVSDSMHKIRVADLVLAIVRTEEDCESGLIRFRLPKRRSAQAHFEIGPLPMDAEHGRLVVSSRSDPW